MLFISLLYSVCYSESMKDEQHQNLNYTPCSEATQRPQSLPRQTGTMLSPSPFSLQISALLLGARQQSKEGIVLFNPIPGTTAQQQHGNLGRECQSLDRLNSCMGHAARGCPAAAGRGFKSRSHLLGLSGSTNHSPIR